jgi:phospholipid/cholesterol/gamma-HCH transport system permease protein
MVADAERLTGSRPNIFIDVSQVSTLDTFGAWLIERLEAILPQARLGRPHHRPLGNRSRADG